MFLWKEDSIKLAFQSKHASSTHVLCYFNSSNAIINAELGIYSKATAINGESKVEKNAMFAVNNHDLLHSFHKSNIARKKSIFLFTQDNYSSLSHKNKEYYCK